MNGYRSQFIELLRMIWIIMILSHCIGCVWHLISVIQIEFMDQDDTWLHTESLIESQWYEKYLKSVFWAVQLLMLINIKGETLLEVTFQTLILYFTVGIFAYMLENISQLLQQINKEEQQFKNDLEIINKYMKGKNLDQTTQIKVRQQLEYCYKSIQEINTNAEAVKVLKQLPIYLMEKINLQINESILSHFQVFNSFSTQTIDNLKKIMQEVSYVSHDIIFQKDQPQKDINLYLILSGENNKNCKIRGDQIHTIKTLKEGQFFGDDFFFTGLNPNYSAQAVKFSNICKINRDDFINLLKIVPKDYELFLNVKEQLIHQGIQSMYTKNCIICDQSYHSYQKCEQLHLKINPFKYTLKLHNQNLTENKRQRFYRTKPPVYTSAFKEIESLQFVNLHFRDKYPEYIQLYQKNDVKYQHDINQSTSSSDENVGVKKHKQNFIIDEDSNDDNGSSNSSSNLNDFDDSNKTRQSIFSNNSDNKKKHISSKQSLILNKPNINKKGKKNSEIKSSINVNIKKDIKQNRQSIIMFQQKYSTFLDIQKDQKQSQPKIISLNSVQQNASERTSLTYIEDIIPEEQNYDQQINVTPFQVYKQQTKNIQYSPKYNSNQNNILDKRKNSDGILKTKSNKSNNSTVSPQKSKIRIKEPSTVSPKKKYKKMPSKLIFQDQQTQNKESLKNLNNYNYKNKSVLSQLQQNLDQYTQLGQVNNNNSNNQLLNLLKQASQEQCKKKVYITRASQRLSGQLFIGLQSPSNMSNKSKQSPQYKKKKSKHSFMDFSQRTSFNNQKSQTLISQSYFLEEQEQEFQQQQYWNFFFNFDTQKEYIIYQTPHNLSNIVQNYKKYFKKKIEKNKALSTSKI